MTCLPETTTIVAFFASDRRPASRLSRPIWVATLLALQFVSSLLGPQQTRADAITHFGDGPFFGVPALLDSVGIGSGNTQAETIIETYVVTQDKQEFTFWEDEGSFVATFGFFPTAAVNVDPTDQQAFAEQALAQATVVFDDSLVNPGATFISYLPLGTELTFFLIPNNTLAGFLQTPSAFFPEPGYANYFTPFHSPMFSVADANPAAKDQLLSFSVGDLTLFTWEDISRGFPGTSGENSFLDLSFKVTGIIPEPATFVQCVIALGVMLGWRVFRGYERGALAARGLRGSVGRP